MKVSCIREDLLNCIQIVQKAVPGRSTIPILMGILVETVGGNTLKLTGTDLKLGIESTLPCKVINDGSIVLPSHIFGELVRKLPDEEIIFTGEENNKILFECGKSRFNLAGSPAEDYPSMPVIKEENFIHMSQNLFRNMIRQTNFAVSEDETKNVLTGQLLQIRGDSIRLVALDGFRIALVDGKGKNDKQNEIDVIIPGKTLNEFSKILSSRDSDEFSISLTENQILFDLGSTRVISRLIDGEYLKYEKVLPEDFKTTVIIDKNSLINSIDRAYLLAREEKGNNLIKMNIDGNNLVITSNSEAGNVYEQIEIEKEGDDQEIAFNSRYIMDALRSIDTEKVIMKFINNISPCIIKPFGLENQLNMVLPVMIN
jgi:DNA polymerase-3 subunit beta